MPENSEEYQPSANQSQAQFLARPLMSMDSCELAWAAGLFEGEGYLVRRPVGNRVYMQLGLQTCDRDVLERFISILQNAGMKRETRTSGPKNESKILTRKKREAHHKTAYSWSTTGKPAEFGFQLLRPWLCSRRRRTGDILMREVLATRADATRPRNCKNCGCQFIPTDNGTNKQFCDKRCYGRWKSRQHNYRAQANERSRRYKAKIKSIVPPGQMSLD